MFVFENVIQNLKRVWHNNVVRLIIALHSIGFLYETQKTSEFLKYFNNDNTFFFLFFHFGKLDVQLNFKAEL